jgi:hypothetical protein
LADPDASTRMTARPSWSAISTAGAYGLKGPEAWSRPDARTTNNRAATQYGGI